MNLIYDIYERPKTIKEWILYTLQMVLAVFVATVLIANICGTPVGACLVGACVGTLIYQLFTNFRSPMFISSCGATCSAVIGALSLGGGHNYIAVTIGGTIILVVYTIFALIVKIGGIDVFTKLFPPYIVGPVTMVIGLNLAGFLPTYIGAGRCAIVVALVTMFVTAITAHYLKGFLKTIAFLLGLAAGYLTAVISTVTGHAQLIHFEKVNHFFSVPDFTFLKWSNSPFSWNQIGQIILLFVPVAICSLLEHYSDHRTLSNIVGTDLTKKPGLTRTLLGDGIASAAGTFICGLPNTSYGESVATIGFSKVASVWVSTAAAITMGLLAFVEPFRVFIASIPACAFGGSAMILYGYITCSGLKTLYNSKADLENSKNLIIVSVILTVGVSGVCLFTQSLTGVSLAMVLGVALNLILKSKENLTSK